MKSNYKKHMSAAAVVLSALLVSWQAFTPLTTAFAAGFVGDATSTQAAVEDDQSTQAGDADQSVQSENNVQQGVSEAGSNGGSTESGLASIASSDNVNDEAASAISNASAAVASASDANSNSNMLSNDVVATAGATETATQLTNAVTPVVQSSAYNPNADPIPVDSNVVVGLYKNNDNGTLTDPLGGSEITSDQTLYGQTEITFTDENRPTLAHPNVSYTFPSNISINAQTMDLLDESGSIVGKTVIDENGVVTLKYYEDYLSSEVQKAKFKFSFKMNVGPKGDNGEEKITFPGTGTTVTVKTKDGGVSVKKDAMNGGKYDAATGTYSWIIKVSPASYATNFNIVDTLGENLSFVDGSFKIGSKEDGSDGKAISATIDPSNPRQVTLNLGDLSKGDYCITYKTKVNENVLKALEDGKDLSGIDNQAHWTWGASAEHNDDSGKRYPNSTKYNMAYKWVGWPSEPGAIKWVVKLNYGSLKANMGGYRFSDAANDNQKFLIDDEHPITITRGSENGEAVTPASISKSEDNLEFVFPNDAGENEYYVTYYTAMQDMDTETAVHNTAHVDSPDKEHGPSGSSNEATYTPPSKDYIGKQLVGESSQLKQDSYNGKASWISTIKFANMPSNTDPTSVVFNDAFTNLPDGVTVALDGSTNVVVKAGNTTLEPGVDYDISKAHGAQAKGANLFAITFKNTSAVKALFGKTNVTVAYSTVATAAEGSSTLGEYKNRSSVKVGDLTKNAEASYSVIKGEDELPTPAVSKSGEDAKWDPNYVWQDGSGEKGAWISDWAIYVNRYANENNDKWSWKPAKDLRGQDVVINDAIPNGSEYISGSAKYTLWPNFSNGSNEAAIEPTFTNGNAVFSIPTADGKYTWGESFGTTKVYVCLTYQTATKQRIGTENASGSIVENSAYADAGDIHFDEGTGSSKIDSKVLSKVGEQDGALVKYTIKLNENGLDLNPSGDTVDLIDTMDSKCTYSGALSVTDLNGSPIDSSKWSKRFENVTNADGSTSVRMTLKLPDSTPLIVTYKVKPLGELKSEVGLTNSCTLEGVTQKGAEFSKNFQVIEGSSETESTVYGISITKYDATVDTKLAGATFELRSVTFENGKPVYKVERTGTTDNTGKVEFGKKGDALASNTLFCFVETVAPQGYEISHPEPVYFVLKGSDEIGYKNVVDEATSHGIQPALSQVTFQAYDDKSAELSGTASLAVQKKVNGQDPADDASFEFSLSAVTENAPLPNETTVRTIGKDSQSFGSIEFSEPGTYIYKIEETSVAPNDGNVWTMAQPVYAKVVVGNAANGASSLPVSVTYYSDEECMTVLEGNVATFNNTFTTPSIEPVKIALAAHKTLSGAELSNDQFNFRVIEGTNTVATGTNDADGNVSFSEIEYTEPGEHYYEISEVNAGQTVDGVVYDSTMYKVHVSVTKQGNKLIVTPAYCKGDVTIGASDVVFANKAVTSTSAKATLKVAKTVNGDTPGEDQRFDFELCAASEGAPMPSSAKVTTAGGEPQGFGEISFDKPGTYKYTIHETSELGDGWAKAGDVEAAVLVSDVDGSLLASVSYSSATADGGAALFNNTYVAPKPATMALSAKKTLSGADLTTGQFKFQVKEGDSVVATGTNDADGNVSFSEIEYIEPGEHDYEISEVVPDDAADGVKDGIKYDSTSYGVHVSVTEESGNLIVASSYKNAGGSSISVGDVVFANKTVAPAPAKATLKVSKTVEAGEGSVVDPGERFGFELYKADENGKAAGNPVGSLSMKAGETASFGELTFDKEGTYDYVIHEEGHSGNGWTAADDVPVQVKVEKQGGRLVASVAYDGVAADSAQVVDKYESATGSFSLNLEKTVNGTAPTEGQTFEFSATAVGDNAADAPKLANVETDADGKASFSFSGLNDAYAGKMFTYVISEQLGNGNGWTKAADVAATVEIGQRGDDGELHPTVTYSGASSSIAKFDNKYAATEPITVALSAVKTLDGQAPSAGQKFKFDLSKSSEAGEKGDLVETVENEGGSVAFSGIEFEDAADVWYLITEQPEDGYVCDPKAVKAHVVVTKSEQTNQLSATVIYDGFDAVPTFANKTKPNNPGDDTPGGDTPGSDVPGGDTPHDGNVPSDETPAAPQPAESKGFFVRTSDPAMMLVQGIAGIAVAAACVTVALGLRRLRKRGETRQ